MGPNLNDWRVFVGFGAVFVLIGLVLAAPGDLTGGADLPLGALFGTAGLLFIAWGWTNRR